MAYFVTALALASLCAPAIAHPPGVFVATLPETGSGFKTLADCEKAIRPAKTERKAGADKEGELRGSLFNRTAGNTTRCEMVDGEPLIVVVPKGI